ncbi:hypothetical protein SAMN04488540_104183 [Ferrimonas sediminum]|uniref:MetA-pathway of phenol degradation n=1 Tax=Ferrimonas sediminum TaxID=718193 RepID=A0A1G8Q4G8_9GAMM|nr:hypothetical protein [Ferrimonas sediminum]SDI99652.1 hypothetical protein SAMN04488540_104183 [Ferrimonas sediminum]
MQGNLLLGHSVLFGLALVAQPLQAESQWVTAPTLAYQNPNFTQIPLTLEQRWGNGPWYTQTSVSVTESHLPQLNHPTENGLGARIGGGLRLGPVNISLDLQYQQQKQQSLTVLGFRTEVNF